MPSSVWDGSSLTIVPSVTGRVRIELTTTFSNGEFEIDDLGTIDVLADSESIVGLRAEPQFPQIVMESLNTHYQLSPEIKVRDVPRPIVVTSSAGYSIVSPAVDPAATVDRLGQVTSVHSGTAVLQVSFGGHVNQVNVVVLSFIEN